MIIKSLTLKVAQGRIEFIIASTPNTPWVERQVLTKYEKCISRYRLQAAKSSPDAGAVVAGGAVAAALELVPAGVEEGPSAGLGWGTSAGWLPFLVSVGLTGAPELAEPS